MSSLWHSTENLPAGSLLPLRLARLTPLNKPINGHRGGYHQCPKCSTSFVVPWHTLCLWTRHRDDSSEFDQLRRILPSEDWRGLSRGSSNRRMAFIASLRRTFYCRLLYASAGAGGLNPAEPLEFWLTKGYCRTLAGELLRPSGPMRELLYENYESHIPLWASASAMHGVLLPLAAPQPGKPAKFLRRAKSGFVLEMVPVAADG